MTAPSLSEELSKMLREVVYCETGTIGPILAKLEEGTKIRRDYFVHGAIAIFAAYLILGHSAELVCNLVGFAYPAYASIKALQTTDTTDDTQWLTYWTVFAFFSVIEFASDKIVGWFPFYWLTKLIFLLWLYLPRTQGAKVVYTRFIVPLVDKYGAQLAAIEKEIKDKLQRPDPTPPVEKPENGSVVSNGDSVVPDLPVENGGDHGNEPNPPPVVEIPPPPVEENIPSKEAIPEESKETPPPSPAIDEPTAPPQGPVDNHSGEKDEHGCSVLTHTDSNLIDAKAA